MFTPHKKIINKYKKIKQKLINTKAHHPKKVCENSCVKASASAS
jgi:hypothetical protein